MIEEKQRSVFICGPIVHMFRNGKFDDAFKRMIETTISVFSAKGWNVFSAHMAERFGQVTDLVPDDIRVRDFGWIDSSDLVVFFFPIGRDGLAVRSDGSFMELGYAISAKKQIVIFTEKDKLVLQSPLFRGAAGVAEVKDFEELPLFLDGVSSCKKIILASNNRGKIAEFRTMLKDYDVICPKDLGLSFDVEETGETFYDNALIKARALYELCGVPALAEDSGLCVDALGGAPGVYSARYSGGSDADNITRLLAELAPYADRTAHFECCIVYYDGTDVINAAGKTYGRITDSARGSNGFGYDPVFFSDDLQKTFGEATESEKNGVSHRARALTALSDLLEL